MSHHHTESAEDLQKAESQTASPAQESAVGEILAPAEAEVAPVDAEAEMAKMKDQMLRAVAETENTRRRLHKEAEESRQYAVTSFAKEMLNVADNFRRALDALPKGAAFDEPLKNLVAGVEATERQMLAIFEKFGIQKIDPMDKPFDPHLHRVMMEIEDAARPAGTVVQVLQAGYMIHGRLLREAMVAVSKGGPVVHKLDTSA